MQDLTAKPGEVRIVVRSVWQGLLNWWNPPAAPSVNAAASAPVDTQVNNRSEGPVNGIGVVGNDRSTNLQASEYKPVPATREYQTPKRAHLVDVSRRATDAADPTDEELMEFLAADYEPVAADPEFKRKLRDQLWTLVQGNELTRQ